MRAQISTLFTAGSQGPRAVGDIYWVFSKSLWKGLLINYSNEK